MRRLENVHPLLCAEPVATIVILGTHVVLHRPELADELGQELTAEVKHLADTLAANIVGEPEAQPTLPLEDPPDTAPA